MLFVIYFHISLFVEIVVTVPIEYNPVSCFISVGRVEPRVTQL